MTLPGRTACRQATTCAALTLLGVVVYAAPPASAQEAAPAATAAVSATATVGLSVNTPPRAGMDSMITQRDLPVTMDLLVNDVDPDGDVLSLLGATSAAHGILSSTGGIVTYTPNPGFSGADAFTYLLTDGQGGHDTGHVQVTVVAPIVVGPHPPSDPRPVEAPTAPSTAPQPPAPPAPLPPMVERPATSPVGWAPVAAPAPAGEARVRLARAAVATTGPAVPARPAALPFTGDRTAGLSGLSAWLAGLGALLCLLGRRRPSC